MGSEGAATLQLKPCLTLHWRRWWRRWRGPVHGHRPCARLSLDDGTKTVSIRVERSRARNPQRCIYQNLVKMKYFFSHGSSIERWEDKAIKMRWYQHHVHPQTHLCGLGGILFPRSWVYMGVSQTCVWISIPQAFCVSPLLNLEVLSFHSWPGRSWLHASLNSLILRIKKRADECESRVDNREAENEACDREWDTACRDEEGVWKTKFEKKITVYF